MTFDTRPVFFVVGALINVLAAAMMVPIVVDLMVGNPDWIVFAIAAAVTLSFGGQVMLTNRSSWGALNLHQTFLLTALAWVAGLGYCQQFSFSVSRRFLDGVMERRLG